MSSNDDCDKASSETDADVTIQSPTKLDVNSTVSNQNESYVPNVIETGANDDTPETKVEAKLEDLTQSPVIDAEVVEFKVIYNKQKYDVIFPLDDTVSSLKKHIETITGVPATMQKVMYKGRMPDDSTLREQRVTPGSKIMVVGSTVNDVMSVAVPDTKGIVEDEKNDASNSKELLCKQKPHKTVLDKYGKPDDVMLGIKNAKDPLPSVPISGMYNKVGGKVRLTFKLDSDQLWIGTKERTDKIPMNSIKAVVSEPIDGHEDYHLMGIQLGPTEASRYWIYWVPAQYVNAIKDTILGKWQLF